MSEIRQAFDDGWRLGVAYADRFCDLPGADTDDHCERARDEAWKAMQDAFTSGVAASENLNAQTSAVDPRIRNVTAEIGRAHV